MERANLGVLTGESITTFPDVGCLVPRSALVLCATRQLQIPSRSP